jgi:hypothetical protein
VCINNLGVVSGVVGQMGDFATLPGYLISLSFTFNLKRGPGHVYWPGCAFGIVSFPFCVFIMYSELYVDFLFFIYIFQCSVILLFTMFLHHSAHGGSVFTLKHRSHFKDGGSVEIPVSSKKMDLTMVQSDTKKTDVSEEDTMERMCMCTVAINK